MSSAAHGSTPYYYVPHESRHPVMSAIGLFFVILQASGSTASNGACIACSSAWPGG